MLTNETPSQPEPQEPSCLRNRRGWQEEEEPQLHCHMTRVIGNCETNRYCVARDCYWGGPKFSFLKDHGYIDKSAG